MLTSPNKIYVAVIASFNPEGILRPTAVVWDDGRKFMIDKIEQVKRCASVRAGGIGDRYTVYICGQKRQLFFERSTDMFGNIFGRWFVERL